MIRFVRDLRLVPIVVVASVCLLALKAADLLLDSGYFITADNAPLSDGDATVVHAAPDVTRPGERARSWAQKMFNFPGSSGAPAPAASPEPLSAIALAPADKLNADITGSVATDRAGDKGAMKPQGEAAGARGKDGKAAKDVNGVKEAKPPNGTIIPTDVSPVPSGAERAILERLQERRQELDTRARELDIREGLIAAAEKRVEGKLTEVKQVEAQISVATEKRNDAEVARFKGLVTMYENMKPRDAAKIFDHLEMPVLLEVASKINPRRMSDILAQMSPDMAERLTVELASRATAAAKGGADLPKIEGRPTTP